MTKYLKIHPTHPQKRLLRIAVDILRDGGVIAYPTDSCYALGSRAGDKTALERLRALRKLDQKHHLTLLCRNLSEVGEHARVDDRAFRLIKSVTPGPYTFLLVAARGVPARLLHSKRKTIGLRIPDNRIALELLETLGEAMLSTSLILPGETLPLTDAEQIAQRLRGRVDLVIDGGAGGLEQTTVIDLAAGDAVIVREGIGSLAALGLE